jgi:hypothetical protein
MRRSEVVDLLRSVIERSALTLCDSSSVYDHADYWPASENDVDELLTNMAKAIADMDIPTQILIPMPEGVYAATWQRDGDLIKVDIPGGIPINGKGEEVYDLGIDGVFAKWGLGSLSEVVLSLIESVNRHRERYGPKPGVIPYPMSVAEAIEHFGNGRMS